MTINEGTWDRVIRVVVGFALGYVAWSTWPTEASLLSRTGVVSFISLVIGTIALVTGVVGWCRFSKRRDPFLTTFSKPFPPLE